jgi:hypothetical protein
MVKNMRYARLLALMLSILFVLLLAACSGGEAPQVSDPATDVSETGSESATLAAVDVTAVAETENTEASEEIAATVDPNASPIPTSIFATFDSPEERTALAMPVVFPTAEPTAEGELPVPAPGTLVASSTEDPNADQPFTLIRLIRTGGPEINGEPQQLIIEVEGDGTIRRNELEGQLTQGTVDQLNLLIREMNFFGVQGIFMGVLAPEDTTTYVYQLYVQRGLEERSVSAMEGIIPAELQRLMGDLVLQADLLR